MFQIESLLKSLVLAGAICFAAASAMAQSTGKPTDPQIGDIAYTAGQADGKQGSRIFRRGYDPGSPAVNKKLMALLHKLQITPEASDTSNTIYRNASIKQEELWKLSGAAFDKAYAQNEVAFHEAVTGALESTLIPSAQDGELKSLLETDLKLFREHQKHAERLVSELKSS